MKKIKWQYYFARKFSVQRYETVMKVFYDPYYWQHFRVNIKNILVVPEGRNHAIYMDQAEWPAAVQKIYKKVCKNLKIFRQYMRAISREQDAFIRTTKMVTRGNLKKISNQELLKRYKQWDRAHLEFFIRPIWIPFPVEPVLSEETRARLEMFLTKSGKQTQLDKSFETVFLPEEKNAITKENEALLKVAHKILKNKLNQKESEKLLEKHCKEWQWIPCYDIADRVWNVKYFNKRLTKLLKNPSAVTAELNKLKKEFALRQKEFQKLIKALAPPKRLKELLIMAHYMVHVKDERDDYRRLGTFLAQPLFLELARRAGLNLREIANLLSKEIEAFFKKHKLPPKQKIKSRVKNGYMLLMKNGQPTKIFSGRKMKRLMKIELPPATAGKTKKIRGIIGSKGRARGKVAVVRTKHDLRRVKDGDIMVAVTTHPDFVPAMQKCKAIVTDEGSITCHAAIVSRELKIPCIVGTKVATKTFHDGQTVEVDANKGIIVKCG